MTETSGIRSHSGLAARVRNAVASRKVVGSRRPLIKWEPRQLFLRRRPCVFGIRGLAR